MIDQVCVRDRTTYPLESTKPISMCIMNSMVASNSILLSIPAVAWTGLVQGGRTTVHAM